MDRRALIGGAIGAALGRSVRGRAQQARPNVLLIVLDDMRGADWEALPKTRAALPDHAWYPNFICSTPLCAPSRASILTGQYPRRHGVLGIWPRNGGYPVWRENGLSNVSIQLAFQQAGYRTGLLGKFINSYTGTESPTLVGWEQWAANYDDDQTHRNWFYYRDFVVIENGKRRRVKDEHLTDFVGRYARAFIAPVDGDDRPFFAHVGFKAPHTPLTPAPRFQSLYPDARVARTPAFMEPDLSDKPAYIRRNDEKLAAAEYDEQHRARLQLMAGADDYIAAMVADLTASGQLANTVIMVLSDNGWSMGDHGWREKTVPYDQNLRIPMLLAGPGVPAGENAALVANVDVAPTLAALAGVELTWPVDGVNMLTDQHEAVLTELWSLRNDPASPWWTGIRTARYQYTRYVNGERELYDYENDPFETTNLLASWGGHQPTADPAVVAALEAQLAALRESIPPGPVVQWDSPENKRRRKREARRRQRRRERRRKRNAAQRRAAGREKRQQGKRPKAKRQDQGQAGDD